jgi:diacylglycerol O-acyltransferase
VPDRLSSLDASFLYLEEGTTAMHVGSVMIFAPTGPPAPAPAPAPTSQDRTLDGERFDYDQLLALVSQRIAFAPRYRQRVRDVPGHLGNPVWVDDEQFDLTYHVRRSALPRPGNNDQLQEFVARIQPRVLDRRRPLWEVYLVEGLSDGRFALVTKVHQALVDGEGTLDIAHLLLDELPLASGPGDDGEPWHPASAPGDLELVAGALLDAVRRPSQVVDTVRGGLADVQAVGGRVLSGLGGFASTLARTAARPAPSSPLNAQIGTARRWVMVRTDLEDYRTVRLRLSESTRSPYVEDVTINDVVLATVAGGLRTWLLTRGEAFRDGSSVRAMVPISVYEDSRVADPLDAGSADPARLSSRVTATFVDLPVGEPSASMRLHRVAFSMRQQMDAGRMVGAEAIANVAGFAPPTLHALGARLGSVMSRRLFNLVITNVPGPQHPRYVADARMLSTFPVMPLARGQALAVGLTSYDGGVYFGLNADREAMPDLEVLGQCLVDALAELVEAHSGPAEAAP